MKYRITVHFGRYRFTADCENVAVAFRHVEAIILSPMFTSIYGADNVGRSCAGALMQLAEMERKEREVIWNDVFYVERIREGGKT